MFAFTLLFSLEPILSVWSFISKYSFSAVKFPRLSSTLTLSEICKKFFELEYSALWDNSLLSFFLPDALKGMSGVGLLRFGSKAP